MKNLPKILDVLPKLPNIWDALDPYSPDNLPPIAKKKTSMEWYFGPSYKKLIEARLITEPDLMTDEIKKKFREDKLTLEQQEELVNNLR